MTRKGRQHLLLYQQLSLNALETKPEGYDWRLFPKHHLWLHTLEDTEANPRDEWCYADESEIGKCADLAESMHANSLHRGVLEKYRCWELGCT